MKCAFLVPSLLTALLFTSAGCNTLASSSTVDTKTAPEPEDQELKIKAARADLDSANARLDISKMESVAFDAKQANAEQNARVELALAKQMLVQFDQYSKPGRVNQENLNLKSTKESAAEAQEELEQIELMYKDQDLNDMTREFVVARGRRNAEHAQARILIREANLASIFEHELPMERQRLQLALERAEQGLANLAMESEIGRRNKALAITEATVKVESASKALAKLSEGDSN